MLTIDKTNVHLAFDPEAAPAGTASSGDVIRFRTQDCYAGQIDADGKDFALLDMTKNNPVTGPVYIRDAMPGDVLKLEIRRVETEDHGVMCVRTGKGVYEVEGCHCRRFPIRDGAVCFDRGLRLSVRPMIGVIGVCPPEKTATQLPGEHGGNLDLRELGAGSTLFLTVYLPGALLSVGDLHALQGDGETAICGLEVGGTVELRAAVLKGRRDIPTPFLVTDRAVYTTAADASLDVCSAAAARKMHRWLQSRFGLTDAQAAMLLSLKGNLRVNQVVNPKKGCMMELPLDVLSQLAGHAVTADRISS